MKRFLITTICMCALFCATFGLAFGQMVNFVETTFNEWSDRIDGLLSVFGSGQFKPNDPVDGSVGSLGSDTDIGDIATHIINTYGLNGDFVIYPNVYTGYYYKNNIISKEKIYLSNRLIKVEMNGAILYYDAYNDGAILYESVRYSAIKSQYPTAIFYKNYSLENGDIATVLKPNFEETATTLKEFFENEYNN